MWIKKAKEFKDFQDESKDNKITEDLKRVIDENSPETLAKKIRYMR